MGGHACAGVLPWNRNASPARSGPSNALLSRTVLQFSSSTSHPRRLYLRQGKDDDGMPFSFGH